VGRHGVIVLDTHALLRWLGATQQLSAAAKRALRKVSADRPAVASAVSLFEITTAVRRGRLLLALPLEQWLADMRLLPELRLEPVTPDIAALAGRFGEELHGDPGDRLIAATAISLALPLLSADRRLQAVAGLRTIW
jgi:PIN domain nuclease of toxin-antitoxin system